MTKGYAFSLLEIADTINAPDFSDDLYGDVEFEAKNGWKVRIFYDCGEFDYIASFISPSGEEIDFWKWPDCDAKEILKAYSSVGDTDRLREAFKDTGAKNEEAVAQTNNSSTTPASKQASAD